MSGPGFACPWADHALGGAEAARPRLSKRRSVPPHLLQQLTAVGAAFCWGMNSEGQLADGSYSSRLVPVAVRAP
jgi:hypothetical protein